MARRKAFGALGPLIVHFSVRIIYRIHIVCYFLVVVLFLAFSSSFSTISSTKLSAVTTPATRGGKRHRMLYDGCFCEKDPILVWYRIVCDGCDTFTAFVLQNVSSFDEAPTPSEAR